MDVMQKLGINIDYILGTLKQIVDKGKTGDRIKALKMLWDGYGVGGEDIPKFSGITQKQLESATRAETPL